MSLCVFKMLRRLLPDQTQLELKKKVSSVDARCAPLSEQRGIEMELNSVPSKVVQESFDFLSKFSS